jgi:hypothetical protein
MKKRNFLLAAAALASLTPFARAATYTTGDLILGFEEPGNSEDYVVDLGPASTFINLAASPGTTDITTADYSGAGLGNIAGDLSGQFGSTWYANSNTAGSNLQWGVFGSNGSGFSAKFGLPGNTLFETVAELTPGDGSTDPLEGSASFQSGINQNFASFTSVITGLSATGNSSYASFESSALANSWTGEDVSLAAFGGPIGIEQPTSGDYIGPTNSELDLYELTPSGSSAPATLLGDFTLTSSGQLDFTSAAAVPEPSTYATIGVGAAMLLFFRRRRPAQS